MVFLFFSIEQTANFINRLLKVSVKVLWTSCMQLVLQVVMSLKKAIALKGPEVVLYCKLFQLKNSLSHC